MDVEIVEKEKDVFEIKSDSKTLPNVLPTVLEKKGVDAYAYEPHPLFPEYILHVEGKDALKKLKTALSTVEEEWSDFRKQLNKKK